MNRNEYAVWTTEEPGDLLNRAGNILDLLGVLASECGAPGEQFTLHPGAAEGLAYTLEHASDLVRCAAAKL